MIVMAVHSILTVATAAVTNEPSARRDAIVGDMWADYVAICRKRENEGELGSGDEGSGRSDDESGSDKASGDGAK